VARRRSKGPRTRHDATALRLPTSKAAASKTWVSRRPFVVAGILVLSITRFLTASGWVEETNGYWIIPWGILFGFLLAIVLPKTSQRHSTASLPKRCVVLGGTGLLLGVLWSLLTSVLWGRWMDAFSFITLWLWNVGGLAFGFASAFMKHQPEINRA
jgi:hypothetical protein